MPRQDIHNPFFYFRGQRFEAVIGTSGEYDHWFGSAGDFKVNGQPKGKRGIHQLMTLDLRDPIISNIFSGIDRLPLFYGFHYESGHLEYAIADSRSITITDLDESSYSIDWPYPEYPAEFPVIPFTLTSPSRCSLETFEEDVWQHVDRRFADHFIAIIPPSDAYGVNLWDKKSNCDFVHVKCFIDPSSNHAVVYNECD